MDSLLNTVNLISSASGSPIGIVILVLGCLFAGTFLFQSSARRVLIVFIILAFIYAGTAIWNYWDKVKELEDVIFLALGLLLTMIAGMFVQVVTNNYSKEKGPFEVSGAQLIYPMLFAPIVFYPVWAVGGSQGASLFLFYSAFLNGYFWESVISAAKK